MSLFHWATWICVVNLLMEARSVNAICEEENSCRSCLTSSKLCSWCADEGFNTGENRGRPRCDLAANHKKQQCKDIVDYGHDMKLIKDKNVGIASTNDWIQLQPQEIRIKLRPNKPFTFPVLYQEVKNYPVDLYFVVDLSKTMSDDKENLSKLGIKLVREMKKITENFRFGFGSFVEKNISPFVEQHEKHKTSCKECDINYNFKHVLSLVSDGATFQKKVNESKISGNLDALEAGFDAMMQTLVCDEIGWRNISRRIILFASDGLQHFAGDGKLLGIVKPNDGKCHMNSNFEYSRSLEFDYPSISQIVSAVKKKKANIIFAIDEVYKEEYRRISKLIEGAIVTVLANDSSNIVQVVQENYNKISSRVELITENSEGIKISFHSKCLGKTITETNECKNLKPEKYITFNVTIEVSECPKEGGTKIQSFYIHPVGLEEKLTVHLELICECECEKEHLEERNSQKCNYNGTYECGQCMCYENYVGMECECGDSGATSTVKLDAQCIASDSNRFCSGRGYCLCGQCVCDKTLNNPKKVYTGDFCECDNYSCDKINNVYCGGENQGTCKCGQCLCTEEYSGEDCDCHLSNTSCIAPNGELCNNFGTCECNKCVCSNSYQGKYCEDCPTCQGKCTTTKTCVQCSAFKSKSISVEKCKEQCQNIEVEVVSDFKAANGEEVWKSCQFFDDDDCAFQFKYKYDGQEIYTQVKENKICPQSANIMTITLGLIGGIMLLGLVLLLIWKLVTTLHDRKEYAKFISATDEAKWRTTVNPLYQDATSTFKNPTYQAKPPSK